MLRWPSVIEACAAGLVERHFRTSRLPVAVEVNSATTAMGPMVTLSIKVRRAR